MQPAACVLACLIAAAAASDPSTPSPTHAPADHSTGDGGAHSSHEALTTASYFEAMVIAGVLVSMAAEVVLQHNKIFFIPASGVTILFGMVAGAIIQNSESLKQTALFDETVFTLILLPVIIFESGFALRRSYFFGNIGSILTYAIIGTIIATFFSGFVLYALSESEMLGSHGSDMIKFDLLEALAVAALVSAVDPVATLSTFGALKVEPKLNALCSGEAIINDAVAIVLYRSFSDYINTGGDDSHNSAGSGKPLGTVVGENIGKFFVLSISSTLIGVVVGVITTLIIKFLRVPLGGKHGDSNNHSSAGAADDVKLVTNPGADSSSGQAEEDHHEDSHGHSHVTVIMLIVLSYASFVITESVHQSGIVASLACGVTMNHFTKRNLTEEELDLSNRVFTLLASLADCIIFFLVGINAVLYWTSVSIELCFWMLLLCVIGRLLNIFPLTFLLNKCSTRGQDARVPWNYAVVMWHSGLRGAIAFSIAVALPWQGEKQYLQDEIIGVTSFLIIFTVFVFGGTTQLLLGWMGIQCGVEDTHADHVKAIKAGMKKKGVKKLMMDVIKFAESLILTEHAHQIQLKKRQADGTEMVGSLDQSNTPSPLLQT